MKKLLGLLILAFIISLAACAAPKGNQPSPLPTGVLPAPVTPTQSPEVQEEAKEPADLIAEMTSMSELKNMLGAYYDEDNYVMALSVVDRMIVLEPSDDLYTQRAELHLKLIEEEYRKLNTILAEDMNRVNDSSEYKKHILQTAEACNLSILIPFTPDYASESEVNQIGNLGLNLCSAVWKGNPNTSGYGVFASQGNWFYYADANDGFSLYKAKLDGGAGQKLSSDWAAHINIIGDWVYYVSQSDGGKVYRIRTDGSDRVELSEDTCSGLCVIGDYIFYINTHENNEIYRMKTDGSEREAFSKPASVIFSDGESLYFIGRDYHALVKAALDSGELKVLTDKAAYRAQIVDEWIYYITDNNGMVLMRLPIEGGKAEEVYRSSGKLSSFAISGAHLISSERMADKTESVYIYNLSDMTLLHSLSDFSSDSICIASDGGVYFGNYMDSDRFYRLDAVNGTAKKIT